MTFTAADCTPGSGSSSFSLSLGNAGLSASGYRKNTFTQSGSNGNKKSWAFRTHFVEQKNSFFPEIRFGGGEQGENVLTQVSRQIRREKAGQGGEGEASFVPAPIKIQNSTFLHVIPKLYFLTFVLSSGPS